MSASLVRRGWLSAASAIVLIAGVLATLLIRSTQILGDCPPPPMTFCDYPRTDHRIALRVAVLLGSLAVAAALAALARSVPHD